VNRTPEYVTIYNLIHLEGLNLDDIGIVLAKRGRDV
jgi:hypothetical protein